MDSTWIQTKFHMEFAVAILHCVLLHPCDVMVRNWPLLQVVKYVDVLSLKISGVAKQVVSTAKEVATWRRCTSTTTTTTQRRERLFSTSNTNVRNSLTCHWRVESRYAHTYSENLCIADLLWQGVRAKSTRHHCKLVQEGRRWQNGSRDEANEALADRRAK